MSAHLPQLLINAVGVAAGLCSIASFVPQIVKTWRKRDASGVSLRMFAVTVVTFTLWTLYGFLIESWPIALSNGICFVLSGAVVALRLKFGGASTQT